MKNDGQRIICKHDWRPKIAQHHTHRMLLVLMRVALPGFAPNLLDTHLRYTILLYLSYRTALDTMTKHPPLRPNANALGHMPCLWMVRLMATPVIHDQSVLETCTVNLPDLTACVAKRKPLAYSSPSLSYDIS